MNKDDKEWNEIILKSFFDDEKSELILKCGCGNIKCGRILVIKAAKDVFEFNFIPYKHKRAKYGIVIRDADLEKLREFIK